MRKKDIVIGHVYMAKISGNLCPVKVIKESCYGGWDGINMTTNRSVRIKTAGKLRGRIKTAAKLSDLYSSNI